MKVLFCTTSRVSEQKGGTERITARIASGLQKLGYSCYSAYKFDIDSTFPKTEFKGAYNVYEYPLNAIISDKAIDVVIVQKMTRDIVALKHFIDSHGMRCKIVSVLHFNPGYEEMALCFSNFMSGLFKDKGIAEKVKNVIRVLFYPIYYLLYPLRNKQLYKTVYEYSDKVILLSEHFLSEYQKYAQIKDMSKFVVIPNALSYNQFLDEKDLPKKKKQVLIVSRLFETQKRISLALKIWQRIEMSSEFDDWCLKIVGHGDDFVNYKQMVSDLHLKHIEFCGRQESKPYYVESRIFMMTSAYEGWGLTLTEAQQFGCVPIAFNTFSSLSDIIINGENGFVVKENNFEDYVEKLKTLMNSYSLQKTMSICAISSSKRFALSDIIVRWDKLLKEIVS